MNPGAFHAVTVVAIPVRDEEDHIAGCLRALQVQSQPPDAAVLLLNNCTDRSGAIARGLVRELPFDVRVVSRFLPAAQASAGHARRLAMALAAERAGPDGVLMTTDADSRVPHDWVERNLASLAAGADLVCGRIAVDPDDEALIPAALRADDAREMALLALLDRIAWELDPDPSDPLPRHTEASGASLAVSVAAFTGAGGIPDQPSGEDRAFVAALAQRDARIRHDPDIVVTVSGRTIGRAAGGMADAIRRRMVRQDDFTDEQVEPAAIALRRYSLRAELRRAWQTQAVDPGLAQRLALPLDTLGRALALPFFGAAWHAIERRSPVLRRQRIRFVDLPAELAEARQILADLHPLRDAAAA